MTTPAPAAAPTGWKLPKFGWTFVIFLLPAAFYTAYVFRHLGEIDQRNLRLLGKAAEQVEQVLGEAIPTVANLANNFDTAAEFGERQPYLVPASTDDQDNLRALQDWELQMIAEAAARDDDNAGAHDHYALATGSTTPTSLVDSIGNDPAS